MKKLKLISFAFLAVGFLAACGSGSGTSKLAKSLKNYNTYAFLPSKDTIKNRSFNSNRIHETVVNTVNENMSDEGYEIDRDQPDVLIYVHTIFDERADVNANPVYTSYSYYRPGLYIGPHYEPVMYEDYYTIQRLSGETVQQVPYTERSIVIDFVNRRTKEILWRGTASEEIGTRRTERDVRDYVDEIFKKFP